jgi:hypothetical protein
VQASNKLDTPTRLCEYDEGAQGGCRRTQTILALEAEYDTFVHPEMRWGYQDLWCWHEGNIYYHKYQLEKLLEQDQQVTNADNTNQDILPNFDASVQFLGSVPSRNNSLSALYDAFRNPPAGFPECQLETPQFFQCKDFGQVEITIDDIDRTILNKIQSSFTDNLNPLLTNLNGALYLSGEKVYCGNIFAFEASENAKFGLMMIPTTSSKYKIGDTYFFPFAPLTAEQKTFITNLCLKESTGQGNVVIVDL